LRGLSRTQARTEADAALPSRTHSGRTGSHPHTPRRGRTIIFDRPAPPRRLRSGRGAAGAEQFGAGGSGLCVLCSADGTLDLFELRLLEQLLPADTDHPPPSLTQPLLAMPFPLELLPRDSGAEAELAEAIDVDDQPCLPVAEVDPDIREQRFGAERDLRFHPRDAVLEESDRGNRLGGGFAPRIAEVDRRPHLRDVSLLHALCECLEHLGFGRQPAV